MFFFFEVNVVKYFLKKVTFNINNGGSSAKCPVC